MEPNGNECWCVAQKPQSPVDNTNNDMVWLPLSRDGKVWTGRESCFWTDGADEEYHHFDGLVYHNDKWYVKDVDQATYAAESVWYEYPDSFERLEEDLSRAIEYDDSVMPWTCAYMNQSGDTCEDCKFLSGKCGRNEILKDVISRIHKLAAKEEK